MSSEICLMLFKCIHIGQGKVNKEYVTVDVILGKSVKEKDLGVTNSVDMTYSEISNKIKYLFVTTTTKNYT